MHALVIGGGIAGTTAAVALDKAGIGATVFEAYDRDADGVGAWLTLASNGLDALDTLGLADRVARLGFPTPRSRMYNATGRMIGEFPLGAPRADGKEVHSVRRADLYRELRDAAVDRGVAIEYGKALTDARRTADGRVEAVFADGTTAVGDLLVGADGLRSVVRTVIDPDAPRARYVGLLNTGGFARDLVLPAPYRTEPGMVQFRFGRRCFLGLVVAPDGGVWWFANPPVKREPSRAELAAIGPQQWRDRLLDLFADDRLPARELIEATPHILAGWPTHDFPTVPTWHRDRMVLIGDAAHATSPSAGQGASLSMEDAVVLAMQLRDRPSIDAALVHYEQARRDRVEAAVAMGRRNGSGKAAGPMGRVIRDRVVFPLLTRHAARTGEQPGAWLHNHHIDWDTPVTAR